MSGLARAGFLGLPPNNLSNPRDRISILPIRYHDLSHVERVVEIALALKRQNAYDAADAAYVALTEELHAELWTLGGPLYRNAQGLGFPVNLIS
ncbi:MAG TPA: hypothetical protein VIW80_06570 [Pyrinomonadaceae bacterium]